MSEARQILERAINKFSVDTFNLFFREKSRQFVERKENYSRYNDNDFKDGLKLGEINFSDGDSLIICAFEVKKELSERAGKKAQYEKAKNILKSTENQIFSAGIFIFYDPNGNFRFSLVYPESIGTRRQWNNFRRFTYFVGNDLTNKTFKQRIGEGDFSSLEKIKDAFSVEKVTKEFYESIASWYSWAVDHSKFPKDAEAEENGRNIAVIRLITRMIFIWFMRERGLVPKNLFEEKNIVSILKSISVEDSTYYTAILQNLFFATLSTKKEERQFGSEVRGYKGYNPDFGNQYVFRYQELFKNPDEIKKYFGDIPFLNGGLFECLDDKQSGIIIDGFSRTKKNQPDVPNFLFFSGERIADLNKAYGTKGKKYKVSGLLNILSSFNFTIDENSPDDQDIALDPELLGRVFENLLASFNPETSTTARKSTGSYYTPREIVDYMVAESLKAYFKTHLSDIQNIDEKLGTLFSASNQENPFDKAQSKKLVDFIESVKIVDPAVGSGAFPMGALNKLVFILNKVDQGNELWKQAQLKAVDAIPDPSVKREAKTRIEEFFKGKNADYGRKLYLIQRCIYGVDIQQIAVEIAKLRFFISLLVDEKIDQTKDNWGIEPLPNLDFKIMQGNSLISEFLGIDFDNGHEKQEKQAQAGLLFEQEDDSLIKEFEQKKIDFQNESDKDRKAQLKEEVEDLMIRIFEEKAKKQKADYFRQMEEIEQKYSILPNKQKCEEIIAQEKQKLSKRSGFDLANIEKQLREFTSKKKTRPFFPWRLYFAEVFEKGGFDIVIANPPYIDSETMVKEQPTLRVTYSEHYATAKGNWDLYVPFLELGHTILTNTGIASYITPNKWYAIGYGKEIRKKLIKNIFSIGNCNSVKVFEAGNSPVVTIFGKNSQTQDIRVDKFNDNYSIESSLRVKRRFLSDNLGLALSDFLPMITSKILNQPKTICDYYVAENPCSVSEAYEIKEIIENLSNPKDNERSYFRFINTGTIDPFLSLWGKKNTTYLKTKYSNPVINKLAFKKLFSKRYEQTIKPKLIISGMRHFESFFDEDGHYLAGKSTEILFKKNELSLKIALGLLNSKLISFYIKQAYSVLGIDGGINFTTDMIESLPIPEINTTELQKPFIEIVDKILAITKYSDYIDNPANQAKVKEYEKQIDQLVYKLYSLTPEEIEIVEG